MVDGQVMLWWWKMQFKMEAVLPYIEGRSLIDADVKEIQLLQLARVSARWRRSTTVDDGRKREEEAAESAQW